MARARRTMDLGERAETTSSQTERATTTSAWRQQWTWSAVRPWRRRGLVRRSCRPCPLPAAPPPRAAFSRLCSPEREARRCLQWEGDGRREQGPPPIGDQEGRRGRWGEKERGGWVTRSCAGSRARVGPMRVKGTKRIKSESKITLVATADGR
jgi:hypothetical protein